MSEVKKVVSKRETLKRTKSDEGQQVEQKQDVFFVVGIGASAGGLESLKVFFDHTPGDIGMAFIVVQHLDPKHKSLLSELISGHTSMKVTEVVDGSVVQPNAVYIIPPNKDLKISNRTLLLLEPAENRAQRRPIDSFFHSLASDQKDKAIGIILSGTGTEGTLGLKEIRGEGGMTIVQDPHTAQFPGMPESAMAAKTYDYVLPPEKMSDLLRLYAIRRSSTIIKKAESTLPLDNQLQKIFLIIRNQTGYDFSHYKTNTIIRRITKRIAINQLNSIEDYISLLQINTEEVEKLYKDFLIGVTSFFRDKYTFEMVEKKAIPYLLEKTRDKQEIRLWVCGCSTGEEAYSLGILIKEAFGKSRQYAKAMIFASDIDKEAIEFARNGVYSEAMLADVAPERVSRYFVKQDNSYQVKKEIREMVVFAHHNVIKDPPFSKMDMISCRNLLIYMDSELQKRVLPIFHYSLNTDGILLLGTSESIGDNSDLFSPIDEKAKLYRRNPVSTGKTGFVYEIPQARHDKVLSESSQKSGVRTRMEVPGITEKILLDQYAPPSVIIDKNNDAVYFSGNTGLYLEPPKGIARLNILEMARKGLKNDLEDAIKKARKENAEVEKRKIEVKVNEGFKTVNLVVKPLFTKDYVSGTLMIIFEPYDEKTGKSKALKNVGKKFAASDLKRELKVTREHLQSAINELESTNLDLQSTNEEYQSSNEELQSTNEELETSREELQSVNEELITVNTELSSKIEQLSQANNDLNNLLRSIEVATLYLDQDLKIKRFTPAATKIFNVIQSDIERPITQLSTNLLFKGLPQEIDEVLKTLTVKSIEVCSVDGTWYYMRIIPYRTADNIIEGVLVTLVDITQQKNVEQKLKKTNEHLNLIMENLPAVPYTCVLEPELNIDFIGKSCEKITGFLSDQFIGRMSFWMKRIHPGDRKKILNFFSAVSKTKKIDHPFRWKCADGKYKHFLNYIRFVSAENGRPAYVVGVWQEIPDHRTGIKK